MTANYRITPPTRRPAPDTRGLRLSESERWIIANVRKLDDTALLDLMSALRPGSRAEGSHA